MAGIDVGDKLTITFDGERWSAFKDGVLIGRLNWAADALEVPSWVDGKPLAIRDGVLEVQRVFVSSDRKVVNLGGIARGT
ncbi:hypothetical protein [Glaciibacter psychrotolerans]|uniref:Uncharacterized protein n=1 Tax=Glaciibacter psychrotolerans TaxID=670054 RepID=A0A7Z0ECD1_9MICO|nr:hypothetical protein [Leifsonia psychrotolerans]NYJ18913.1 hypothetical protein [Leifsonia psychrotolerans]